MLLLKTKLVITMLVCWCVLVLCFYDYVLIVVQDVLFFLSVLDLFYCVSLCAAILA